MKKYLLIILLFPLAVNSQDCKTYLFLQNNKTIEMTLYNRKGDMSGKQVYRVSDYKTNGGVATAAVHSEMYDKKGKSIVTSLNNIKCQNGVMMMDMKINMPQSAAMQMKTSDVKTENFYVEYPAGMSVGDVLKEAHMELNIDNNSMRQSITMDVINRKVEGKESVTTPAGTWECFKISNNTKMKIKTMGIGIPMNVDAIEWFAPGFGIIKSESKFGQTLITSIN